MWDVAEAQILLLESSGASGRHLWRNGKGFCETVAKLCPRFNVHKFTEETQPGLVAHKDAAKKKLIGLGMAFAPTEAAINEREAILRARGFFAQPNCVETK